MKQNKTATKPPKKLMMCKPEFFNQETKGELETLRNTIKNREALWKNIRPWRQDVLKEWKGSIHSKADLRNGIKQFQAAHIQRDELAAKEALSDMIGSSVNWAGDMLAKQPVGWFIDAVGYLMLAIMPRRDQEDTTERLCIAQNCWSPSNAARTWAQSNKITPWVIDSVGSKRFGSLKTTVPKRHVPIAAGSDLGNRTTLLEKLKAEVTQRELASTVPKDIIDAFWIAFNQTEADAKVTGEHEWLPNFNFELRGWRSKANQGHSGTAPALAATNYNGPAPQQYTEGQTLNQALQGLDLSGAPGPASPPPAGGRRSAPPSLDLANPSRASSPLPQSPGLTGQPSGAAKSARRSAPDQQWQATYYTIGEVGNHRYRTDLWALVDDGRSGFDIYDVTVLKKTLLGLKARPEFQKELKESHEPIGKLIRPMRSEEIAERDGEHGRPFWIILGQDVFDITGLEAFPFESTAQRIMLRSNPGGNPMHAIDEDDTVTPEQVVDYLWPYRCATLAEPRPAEGPGASSGCLYTSKEVAWHTYRETGMYTIIRDNVYDMTEFVDCHPGGTTLIEQWAGKDATEAFNRYHYDAERCLADYDFLRIGRVIKEARLPIAINQIIVHGMVYDLTPIDSWMVYGWKEIQEATQSLRGTDASEKVMADLVVDVPDVLLDLISRRELIVAKIPPPLPKVTPEELASNDGSIMDLPGELVNSDPAKLPPLRRPVWVSHGRNVYDVTAFCEYGEDSLRGAIESYMGKTIPTGPLSKRLEQDFSHRIIGVLVKVFSQDTTSPFNKTFVIRFWIHNSHWLGERQRLSAKASDKVKPEPSWRAKKPGYQHQRSRRPRPLPHKRWSAGLTAPIRMGHRSWAKPGFSVAPPYQPDKSDCGPSIAAATWLGSARRLTSVGYNFVGLFGGSGF
ncbi:hypothetical protein INS49_015712 [Diaporthe citri]|uniref:uncharacterized protein n=1 Tax=Diaporthe citri TaxID=83186 RepID=UPI001C814306|nr:uncharacterized protein INS49_015712 [Diaporthe citri]KAG6356324.1 hypothetical protein INS49_015712 [Diaporthe citri]